MLYLARQLVPMGFRHLHHKQSKALFGHANHQSACLQLLKRLYSGTSDDGVMLLPMPSLSHAMTSGAVSKWLKAEGDKVNIYDLLLELYTDNLVEEAYKVGDFAGRVTMLLESQEAGTLRKILVEEGQVVPVGKPIAIITDDEADSPSDLPLSGLPGNVYDPDQRPARILEWQSYLKEGSSPSSSCGCN
jgi:pyruvate/2-oxoglutarate dehydrogenase complex dihydrolipoamide acyltransferase (E2) component